MHCLHIQTKSAGFILHAAHCLLFHFTYYTLHDRHGIEMASGGASWGGPLGASWGLLGPTWGLLGQHGNDMAMT